MKQVEEKIVMEVGKKKVIEKEKRIGVKQKIEKNDQMEIGKQEVKIIELKEEYVKLENGGYREKVYLIKKVKD